MFLRYGHMALSSSSDLLFFCFAGGKKWINTLTQSDWKIRVLCLFSWYANSVSQVLSFKLIWHYSELGFSCISRCKYYNATLNSGRNNKINELTACCVSSACFLECVSLNWISRVPKRTGQTGPHLVFFKSWSRFECLTLSTWFKPIGCQRQDWTSPHFD